METLITALTTNKIILIIAVIVSIIIVISAAKKLVKVAAVVLAVVVLYAAYLVYSGQHVPKTRREAVQHVTKKFDEILKSEIKVPRHGR